MIIVDVVSKDDGFLDIRASGHADSRLCASVSTLQQSNIRFLQELADQYPDELQVNVKEE